MAYCSWACDRKVRDLEYIIVREGFHCSWKLDGEVQMKNAWVENWIKREKQKRGSLRKSWKVVESPLSYKNWYGAICGSSLSSRGSSRRSDAPKIAPGITLVLLRRNTTEREWWSWIEVERNGIRAGVTKSFHEINYTKQRRTRTCLMYEVQNKLAPSYIQNLFTHVSDIHSYNTRSATTNKILCHVFSS